MKVESAFTINGVVVNKAFQKGKIAVYEDNQDCTDVTCYFVDNEKGTVLFKQTISADMGQGTGFVSSVNYLGIN